MSKKQTRWIVRDENGRIRGPYSTEDVFERIEQGVFSGEEQISKYPGNEWYPISQDPQFYDQILAALSEGIDDPQERTTRLRKLAQQKEEDEPSIQRASLDTGSKGPGTKGTEEVQGEPVEEDGSAFDFSPNDEEPDDFEIEMVTPKQEPTSSRASRVTRSITSKSEVIQLTDQKKVKKRARRKANRRPLVVLLLIVIGAVGYLLLDEEHRSSQPTEGLIYPRKLEAVPENYQDLAQERLANGTRNYLGDTLSGYRLALRDFVQALEYDRRNAGTWSWLCMTYLELWPYTDQGAKETRMLRAAVQEVSRLEPTGINSSTCKVVAQMTKGQMLEAATLTNSILENSASLGQPPVAFYYFKALQLTDPKDVFTAIGYVRSAQQLLPQWMRVFSYEAELQMRAGQASSAANIYIKILNATQNRHVVSQLQLGILEYRNFNRVDRAYSILQPALAQEPIEAPNELVGRAYLSLAEISAKYQKLDEALKFAKKSFAADPTSTGAKNLVLQLGGSDVVKSTQVDVRQLISVGDQYYREGELEEAFSQYQAAYQFDSKNAIAALKAGRSLWRLSMSQDAIQWVNKSIQADYKLIEAYVTLSDYYAKQFDFLSAIKILEKAAKVSPNNFEVYYGFANVQFLSNNPKAAISFGKKALNLYQADTRTHILLAKSYMMMKQFNQAYASASQAVELDGNNREGQVVLAKSLAAIQGVDSGINYLSNLVQKYPLVIDYRMAYAKILLDNERYRDAAQAFTDILQIEYKLKDAHIGLGKAYKELGEVQRALDSFLNGAAVDPSDPTSLFEAGLLYMQTKRYGLARKQFDRVVAVNPRYPLVHYYMGKTALLSRDFKEALAQSKEERKLNPNLPESYLLAAEVYLKTGKYSLCAREYGQAIKLQQLGAVSYVNVSRCYRLSGNLKVAQQMLNRAADVESGYAPIWKELGSIYETQGDFTQAVLSYQKYLALEPGAPDRLQVQTKIRSLQSR